MKIEGDASGGDAEVCARGTSWRTGCSGRIVERELLEVLLEGGVCLLGGGQVAGLEIMSQLAEERGDWIRLAGGLAGIAIALVMMMVVAMGRARLRASLLQILLYGGEVRLGGREVARFQILRQLRNSGSQRIAALRARNRCEQR